MPAFCSSASCVTFGIKFQSIGALPEPMSFPFAGLLGINLMSTNGMSMEIHGPPNLKHSLIILSAVSVAALLMVLTRPISFCFWMLNMIEEGGNHIFRLMYILGILFGSRLVFKMCRERHVPRSALDKLHSCPLLKQCNCNFVLVWTYLFP